eukprot:1420482-Rhodomonas_salina.1
MTRTELMNGTNREHGPRERRLFLLSRVGVRLMDYGRAESCCYELQRVASASAEGAYSRKDKTNDAILLGD